MLKVKKLFNHHKKIVWGSGSLVIIAFLMVLSGWGVLPYSAQADPPIEITIEDVPLNTCLHVALDLPAITPITDVDAQGLTSLTCNDMSITNLTGLEYFTSLNYLSMEENSIIDLTPLSNLTSLTQLYLRYNAITDISALSNLTSLTDLYLLGNTLSDLTPISNLSTLISLNLGGDSITDISALSSLSSLSYLYLSWTSLSDLSALSSLTSLSTLILGNNSISDLQPLASLTALTYLYLENNEIVDISPLSNLTSLSILYLGDNSIADIDALSNLTALTDLYLSYNDVSDITALTNLTSLSYVTLSVNNVSSISPLTNNIGINSGDTLDLEGNPLNSLVDIEILQDRDVTVGYNQVCGNGEITLPEECDDGNNTDGDSCSNACLIEEESTPFTVTDVGIFTDRIIVNFSNAVMSGPAMECSNYIVNGEELECGFASTPVGTALGYTDKPYVDFKSNYIAIKNIDLSGTVTFEITEDNNITDQEYNSLEPYSTEQEALDLDLPTITSLSTSSGAVGDELTLEGASFGITDTPGDETHKIYFNGGYSSISGPLPAVEADYTEASWSDTSITVKVPAGAASGSVQVMVDGLYSDDSYSVYFDVAGDYNFRVYYENTDNAIPAVDVGNVRLAVGDMTGMHSFSLDDDEMTFDAETGIFTVTDISANAWVWIYDDSGDYLNSNGVSVNLSATQDFILNPAAYSISGTLTLGTVCTEEGQNADITVYAYGTVINDWTAYTSIQSTFYTTDSNCQADYTLAVSTSGTYNVATYRSYSSDNAGASLFLTPEAQSVTVNSDQSNVDFTYTSALYKIEGQVTKPEGDLDSSDVGMLWVYGYMPNSNKYTGTQVNEDGTFTVYVDAGIWKIGVSGSLPYPIEKTITVDDTFLMSDYQAGTIEYVVAPPTDFIEGYVKDNLENGVSKVSVYAWCDGGSGGGSKITNGTGYFKIFVPACDNYHVGGYSWEYGPLTEQSGIEVNSETHPTVNFTVSGTTISGQVLKNDETLTQVNVYLTEGRWGNYLGGGFTNDNGNYSFKVQTGDNRWIHVVQPTGGEIYTAELGTISEDLIEDIDISVVTITVNVSPGSDVNNAFFSFYGENGSGWSNTNMSIDPDYKQYQIELTQPVSDTAIYYLNGYVEGYGPIYSDNYLEIDSDGNITESNGTANDGIFEYSLSGFYEISGTVEGENVDGAWVWASGTNGYSGALVQNNQFSFKLRDGSYNIGINKPGSRGSIQTITVEGEAVVIEGLELTPPDATLSGTVYLPDGTTPAANVWISVYDNQGGWFGANSDANGEYTMDIVSGDYALNAGYECYYYSGQQVTAPAEDLNITLSLSEGCSTSMTSAPITPNDGGVIKDDTTTVTIPGNALGSDTNAGTVDIKSVQNVPQTSSSKVVGTAREITAKNSDEQNITSLSEAITLSFNLTEAEVVDSGATTIDDVMQMTIAYWDATTNNWMTIDDTVVTLYPATAETISELDDDLAITLTGTVSHLSLFAPIFPLNESAPATPTNVTAEAGNQLVTLSWTASEGATKYYIYQQDGDSYPFLAETENTTYEAADLTNGVQVSFKVTAVNGAEHESAASSVASATPSSGTIAPRRNYGSEVTPVSPAETIVLNPIIKEDDSLITEKETAKTAETPKTPVDVTNIKTETTVVEAQPVKPKERSLEKEVNAIKEFVALTKSIPKSTETWKVIDYLAYGSTPKTKSLTEKQRQTSLTDYKLIYGTLPQTENDWLNLAKIIEGKTPTRVLSREAEATKFYAKIFNKLVDLKKSTDSEFVDTIAYLKQVNTRDLEKEKQGIVKFVKTFRKLPTDSLSWAIVRALAYFSEIK